jgi:hypothetical protein
VFFLIEGRVSFLLKDILPYKNMVVGSYFGEVDILLKRRRTRTARSDQKSEFLTLSKKVLLIQNLFRFIADRRCN